MSKMRRREFRRTLAVPLSAILALTAVALTPTVAGANGRPGHGGHDDEITTVATGLDNPRGVTFGSDGSLYVAEAGRGGEGPCFPGPEGPEVCFGASGAVTRVRHGRQARVVTGLPSLAEADGSAAIGPSDVSAGSSLHFTVGLGADPALRDQAPELGQEALGWLLRSRGKAGFKQVADIAGFEAANNPDGNVPDSNPNSVVPSGRGGWYVADAGGNSLLHVDHRGRVKTVAVFPDRMVDAPPFLGLPPGTQIPMQTVPTSVVRGPDGALYVGELTGFPFQAGAARVHRVVPGKAPKVVASGFTNIIDIGFDRRGRLYVLEIDQNGLLTPDFAGALTRVNRNGSHKVVVGEGLFGPGGLAIRGDAAYVSNCSVCAGTGEILRISLD
jgi:hypothetical protein